MNNDDKALLIILTNILRTTDYRMTCSHCESRIPFDQIEPTLTSDGFDTLIATCPRCKHTGEFFSGHTNFF